jgi:hypothetical protein
MCAGVGVQVAAITALHVWPANAPLSFSLSLSLSLCDVHFRRTPRMYHARACRVYELFFPNQNLKAISNMLVTELKMLRTFSSVS